MSVLKETDALLEGHFILSSGKHSARYFQCAKLLQYPNVAEGVFFTLAQKMKESLVFNDDIICVGPAIGGIIPAWVLGKYLYYPAIYTERNEKDEMVLRRGFEVEGKEAIIVEDVITTGKSSKECANAIIKAGGTIKALVCIVDRRIDDTDIEWPLFSYEKIPTENYDAVDCPLCEKGVPLEKPGTRKIM